MSIMLSISVVAVFCGDILGHVGPDEFMASFSSNMLLSDIFIGFEGVLHLQLKVLCNEKQKLNEM